MVNGREFPWMNPGTKQQNGSSRRQRSRGIRTPIDFRSSWRDSSAMTSPPAVSIATDRQPTTSQETFVTFGKIHRDNCNNNNNITNADSDDVIHENVSNDVTTESIPEMHNNRMTRGSQTDENILKVNFQLREVSDNLE